MSGIRQIAYPITAIKLQILDFHSKSIKKYLRDQLSLSLLINITTLIRIKRIKKRLITKRNLKSKGYLLNYIEIKNELKMKCSIKKKGNKVI